MGHHKADILIDLAPQAPRKAILILEESTC